MTTVARLSVLEAWDRLEAKAPMLLVCAYDSESRWRKNRIPGAIPLWEFEERLPSLDRATEIVFY